jgi:hypothetical protein
VKLILVTIKQRDPTVLVMITLMSQGTTLIMHYGPMQGFPETSPDSPSSTPSGNMAHSQTFKFTWIIEEGQHGRVIHVL